MIFFLKEIFASAPRSCKREFRPFWRNFHPRIPPIRADMISVHADSTSSVRTGFYRPRIKPHVRGNVDIRTKWTSGQYFLL
jgi:hypothetical protein